MKVKNISGNTIYAEDVDMHIPFSNDAILILSPDILKKSRSLRSVLFNNMLEVIEYDPEEQIEKSIMYTRSSIQKEEITEEKEDIEVYSVPKLKTNIDVKIHGIFYEAGGYGKVNRYLAKNLSEAGVNVQISPKKGQNQLNSDELKDIIKLEKTILDKNHIVIDSIIPSFSEISSAKYRILYTTIEAYTVPQQFVDCCKNYNEIWVTSDHGKEILEKQLDQSIYIVPTGVDPDVYNENVDPVRFNPPLKDFVFLSVFGWSYRKGYDALFKAYFDSFTSEDNVSLLVFSRYMQGNKPAYKKKIQDDIDKLLPRQNNLPHYKVVSKVVPENLLPQIYRACNAFVLPSRGEGSCLPPTEASLCGLPVIMTNCSGQKLYLNSDNSYLFEIDNFMIVPPNLFHVHYWDGQKFPNLKSEKCISDLAGLMRFVYENYSVAKKKNKKLQKNLLENFTWKHAATKALERLKIVQKGLNREHCNT